ncbi:MAG: DUF2461 domain-containing protein [Sporichthyaceae bacterium]
MAARGAFRGFPAEAIDFFEGLAADNSKAYWTEHSATYLAAVKEPMQALLADVEAEFGPGRLRRAHRDVRFAKDKSPYHLHLSAGVPTEVGEYYVAIKYDCLIAGVGAYELDGAKLARVRAAVDDDRRGRDLERRIAAAEKAGLVLSGPALTRAPRGYPSDHPRLRLLTRKAMVVARSWPPAAWFESAQARQHVVATWRAGRPVLEWLEEVL